MYINNTSYNTAESITVCDKIRRFMFENIYNNESYINTLCTSIEQELQLHNVKFDSCNFHFIGEANIPNTFAYFYYGSMTNVFNKFFENNLDLKKELIHFIGQTELSFYNICEIITLKPNTVIIKLV